MIEANDGGGTISINGGETWTPEPMPTAQFYHVITTRHVPYHVCGAQQDNSTACVSSARRRAARADPAAAPIRCSIRSAAARAATSRSDPRNPDIFYAGSYGGLITRLDRRTGQEREVNPYPDNPMGYGSADIAERFQWTFPIVMAPTDPRIIYVGSQHVWKSTNEGQSWDEDQPGPDASRSEDDGAVGRADHQGQHRRRNLRDGVHDRAVAARTPTSSGRALTMATCR